MTGIKTPTSSEEHSWAADKEDSGLTGGTAFSQTQTKQQQRPHARSLAALKQTRDLISVV